MSNNEYDDIEAISKEYKIIPLYKEIFSDITTPIQVLLKLKQEDEHCFLLESVEKAEKIGRYSFLGFEPSMEITCRNNKLRIKKDGKTEKSVCSAPQEYIKKIIDEHTDVYGRTCRIFLL